VRIYAIANPLTVNYLKLLSASREQLELGLPEPPKSLSPEEWEIHNRYRAMGMI